MMNRGLAILDHSIYGNHGMYECAILLLDKRGLMVIGAHDEIYDHIDAMIDLIVALEIV